MQLAASSAFYLEYFTKARAGKNDFLTESFFRNPDEAKT